jgi:hypothetical protein
VLIDIKEVTVGDFRFSHQSTPRLHNTISKKAVIFNCFGLACPYSVLLSVIYSQLSIIRDNNGGEEVHRQPKTTVKTKAVKTWFKTDLK